MQNDFINYLQNLHTKIKTCKIIYNLDETDRDKNAKFWIAASVRYYDLKKIFSPQLCSTNSMANVSQDTTIRLAKAALQFTSHG